MTQRPDDKEWDEFQLWLQFKRERSQEITVVVTAEQPELLLEQEPQARPARKPKYPMKKDVKNFQQSYTSTENRLIGDLVGANWSYQDIADHLGRSKDGIKTQYLKHIKGTL